jgi:hypothetical protein
MKILKELRIMINKKVISGTMAIMLLCAALSGCARQPSEQTVKDIRLDSPETEQATPPQEPTEASSETAEDLPLIIEEPSTVDSTELAEAGAATVQKEAGESFFGEWQIEKVLANSRVSTYGNDEINNSIIGKKIILSQGKATCFGDSIETLNRTAVNPVYVKTVLSKNDFETGYNATFESLGLGDSITEVSAADAENGCLFFIKNEDTLILYGGGVFFELKRV